MMEACGLVFSRILVTNAQGEPPLPFGAMDKQGLGGQSNVKRMK